MPDAMDAFKKTFSSRGVVRQLADTGRDLVPDESGRPEDKITCRWARRARVPELFRSSFLILLSFRCGLPRTRKARPPPAFCNTEAMTCTSPRSLQVSPLALTQSSTSIKLAGTSPKISVPTNYRSSAAATCAELNLETSSSSCEKLALEPRVQIFDDIFYHCCFAGTGFSISLVHHVHRIARWAFGLICGTWHNSDRWSVITILIALSSNPMEELNRCLPV